MALREDMSRRGTHLFRWRGYFPLFYLPVLFLALKDFRYLGGSEATELMWDSGCILIAAGGLLVRILTVGFAAARSSGRNSKYQEAATLNTTGMYSLVRHPVYFANFLLWMAINLFVHNGWLSAIAILLFWVFYERIMLAEELFLRTRFGAVFEAWASRTPTFVPNPKLWKAPDLPFSWQAVLARENSTLFATATTFAILQMAKDLSLGRSFNWRPGWMIPFVAIVVAYAVLRWMKKRGLLPIKGARRVGTATAVVPVEGDPPVAPYA
ncbi:MAG TPA: isoprenylcysteine carboxylmethyltransferase family protein [Thermoanaerobaculia bacterium]|nr:isoprenylcysteine carboxylmethyltransferase family protein [Thermoanaerobaculia bacterium]